MSHVFIEFILASTYTTYQWYDYIGILEWLRPIIEPLILIAGLYGGTKAVRRVIRPRMKNTPILVSTAFMGGVAVRVGAGDTPNGLHYEFHNADTSEFFDNDEHSSQFLYTVELPFESGVHLFGSPRKAKNTVKIDLTNSSMEYVVLEGDYPNYFSLYADLDQQVQSRYVLDPAAMVFTIDFCGTYNWEILEDTLYVMTNEKFTSLDIIDQFVREIQPAIEIESTRKANPNKMAYGEQIGRTFQCPICTTALVKRDGWCECPDGHGVFVTGRQLSELRAKAASPSGASKRLQQKYEVVKDRQLACPFCTNVMKVTQYQVLNVYIDVCTKCTYRWIDGEEMAAIFSVN